MLVLGHLRVGDPTPVGRELRGGVGRNGVLAQQGRGLGGDIEQAYLVVAVGVDDALAVGAPVEVVDAGLGSRGELHRLAAAGWPHPQLGLAGGIAYVGNVFAVGAPVGIALVHTGSVGDVAGHTFAGRHVKDFAACCNGQSVAVGREAAAGHVVFHVALLLACKVVLAVECDVDFAVLLAGGVELIDVAAVFKHNLAAATAGELHIIVGEIGHLGSRLGCGVVAIHVHALVAVAYEVDLVAYPHGKDVLRHIVGDVGHLLAAGVINPNVVGHAALVILPGAELSKHAIIGQLGAVGREAAKSAFGQGQLRGHAAVERSLPQGAHKAVALTVAIHHLLAVGGPAHGDVVGTHAVAHVVARVGGRVGDAARFAALAWHHIHLGVAVVLASEGQLGAVGRITWKNLISLVRGELHGNPSCDGYRVDVAGIGESDLSPVGRRKSQQSSLTRPCRVRRRRNNRG